MLSGTHLYKSRARLSTPFHSCFRDSCASTPYTLIQKTIYSKTEGNKAVHLQRPCPVCQGAGRVVSRRKARAMAIEGVVTTRRRPPGFVMKGPVPPPERVEAVHPERGEALCYLTGARRA